MQIFNFLKRYNQKREYKKRNIDLLSNSEIYPKIGLVLNLDFHLSNRWVVAVTPYLKDRLIDDLKCIIIQNQRDYNRYKDSLDVIISTHPGWSAPFIKYDKKKPELKYIIYGDPHKAPERYQQYFKKNTFSYVLAYYLNPTILHFKNIDKKKILHFTWAIPDEFVESSPITFRAQKYVMIFGGFKGESYETRNWYRTFSFVKNFNYSGCQNKILVGKEYFEWLKGFDAAIAAGSLSTKYRLVLPKYYEIAAVGGLLLAQEAEDLEIVGFKDNENCIIFNKENFEDKVRAYLNDREAYMPIRYAGRKLILERHTISKRMTWLKEHITKNLIKS